jgi:hypothetical protein
MGSKHVPFCRPTPGPSFFFVKPEIKPERNPRQRDQTISSSRPVKGEHSHETTGKDNGLSGLPEKEKPDQ